MKLGTHRRARLLLLAACAFCIGVEATARAQSVPEPAPEPETALAIPPGETLMLDAFVVPGTAGGLEQRQITTSLAISSLYSNELQRLAPRSFGDAVRFSGGFQVESNGGESSGNRIMVRGLPTETGTDYTALLEDGLPLYNDYNEWPFRYSNTIARVESVRMGNSSIAQEQAVAGFINYINKEGGPTFEGEVLAEFGDYEHFRTDVSFGGPLSSNTFFFIGGFHRTNQGIRQVDFDGTKGGMVMGSLKHVLPNEKGYVKATFKKIDDQTIAYTVMPIANPENPSSLPSLDIETDTMLGPGTERFTVPGFTGIIGDVRDAENRGQFTDIYYVDLELNYILGDDWRLNARFRNTDGDIGIESIDGIANVLPAAQMAEVIRSRIVAMGGEWANRYSASAAPGWRLVRTGGLVPWDQAAVPAAEAATLNGNGLLAENAFTNVDQNISNVQFNATLSKRFETGFGSHQLQLGAYSSKHTQRELYVPMTVITDVRNHAERYDIQFLDAADAPVGFGTLNGVAQQQDFANRHEQIKENTALWLIDNITLDKWVLDLGARYHRAGGSFRNWGTWQTPESDQSGGQVATWGLWDSAEAPNPVLARVPVLPANPPLPSVMDELDTVSWSVGASYLLTETQAVWARYSRAGQLPNARGTVGDGFGNDRVQKTKNVEVGYKFGGARYLLQASVFYTTLFGQKFSNRFIDPVTGQVVEESSHRGTETYGAEVEAAVRFGRSANVRWTATVQNPEFDSDNPFVFNGQNYNIKGNTPRMQAKFFMTLGADYSWRNVAGFDAITIFGNAHHVGSRPYDDLNTYDLDSYENVSAGVSVQRGPLTLEVQASNLFNSTGFSWTNPYGGGVTSTGQQVFLATPEMPRSVIAKLIYRF